jgi:hypothetical protein
MTRSGQSAQHVVGGRAGDRRDLLPFRRGFALGFASTRCSGGTPVGAANYRFGYTIPRSQPICGSRSGSSRREELTGLRSELYRRY